MLPKCQKVNIKRFRVIILGQNSQTIMIPIYSTTVLYDEESKWPIQCWCLCLSEYFCKLMLKLCSQKLGECYNADCFLFLASILSYHIWPAPVVKTLAQTPNIICYICYMNTNIMKDLYWLHLNIFMLEESLQLSFIAMPPLLICFTTFIHLFIRLYSSQPAQRCLITWLCPKIQCTSSHDFTIVSYSTVVLYM